MNNPFRKPEAIEEHHIVLGNGIIEVSFHYGTKTVFLIDQTGSASIDPKALETLEKWYKDRGWFLHAVSVSPGTIYNPQYKGEGA